MRVITTTGMSCKTTWTPVLDTYTKQENNNIISSVVCRTFLYNCIGAAN